MRKSTSKRIFCGLLAALLVLSNTDAVTYAAQEDYSAVQAAEQDTTVVSEDTGDNTVSDEQSGQGSGADTQNGQEESNASGSTESNTSEDSSNTESGADAGTTSSGTENTDSSQSASSATSQDASAAGSGQTTSAEENTGKETSSEADTSEYKKDENLTEEEKKAADEKKALEKAEQEKLEKEKLEQEKLEKEKLEKEKLEKEKAAQETEPVNLGTVEESSVSLSLSDFWMTDEAGSRHSAATGSEDGAEVFDFSQIDADLSVNGGFDLAFSCSRTVADREVMASDYIEFTLPSCFANLSASAEDGSYDCSVNGQTVTVTLRQIPEEGDISGRIHFTYTLAESVQTGAEISCLFEVQNGTGSRAYKVIFADTEAAPVDEEIGTFTIKGMVTFNEMLGGVDWSALVRQPEFDENIIKVEQTYTDGNGNTQTETVVLQNGDTKANFYLSMIHDGDGGGEFTIANVPKKIKKDDQTYEITGYKVSLAPKLPYYQFDDSTVINLNEEAIKQSDPVTSVTGTVGLSLKSQTITLNPTIVPEDSADHTVFPMKAVFSNFALEGKGDKAADYKPAVNAENKTTIQVPVGISYEITQSAVEGYRFDGKYTTTSKTEGSEGSSAERKDAATGTVADGTDLTITTSNYSQNQSVKFGVQWVDNNSTNRPTLTAQNFKLQYRVDDTGEWKDLTEQEYTALQITNAPGFDDSQAALGEYAYTGLPAADADGNKISYQVVTDQEVENYTTSYTDSISEGETTAKRTFTFREKTDFQATIQWNDASEKDNRPDKEKVLQSLKLYRRVGNTYELVDTKESLHALSNVDVTENGDSWMVTVKDLPRYNDDNQEYDYVLVHGSIDGEGDITPSQVSDQYRAYYDNGSGNYGNDTTLCHNNGKITEVLYKTVDFNAQKIWKDPTGTGETRPETTVTLWRYRTCDAYSIDDAYSKGKAAQVVFKSSGEEQTEKIATYTLDNSKESVEIKFTSENVADMPADFKLPAYDDHGHEYVYFVRETLSGSNADEYEIQYTGTEDSKTVTYQNGAPASGTITNVRRKKEEVQVSKIWKDPSGKGNIEGVSVQVEIQAKADGGTKYDTLAVLSDALNSYDKLSEKDAKTAQTITGFTSAITHGEVSYYVNTYDSEGRAYDMEHAKVVETVTDNKGNEWKVTKDAAGNTTITDADGNAYAVSTSFEGAVSQGDGTNQYRYTQTNTITAKRDYTLTKEWANSIDKDDLAKIKAVNFKLYRRSTKEADSKYTPVKTSDNEEVWQVTAGKGDDGKTAAFAVGSKYSLKITNLPKYDADGYEYYYKAEEVSFETTDGTTITTKQEPASKWSTIYYRSTEETTAYNYVSTEGGRGFVTINKIWQDNGDEDKRGDVTLRVYLREQLKEALGEAKTDGSDDAVALDSLKLKDGSNLKYHSITLKKDAQYTAYLNYAEIDEAILGKEEAAKSKYGMKDYIILEMGTGSDAEDAAAPSYSYAQLSEAANGKNSYQIRGTVENNDRQYTATVTANISEQLLLLTNTRAGEASITVTKNWQDGKNEMEDRPDSVQFQLYKDGAVYKDIPTSVKVEAKAVSSTSEGGSGAESAKKSCSVKLDHTTGIVTVSYLKDSDEDNTKENWIFTVTGLDMFNAAGEPITYNVDEVSSDTESIGDIDAIQVSGTSTYVKKKTASGVTDNGKTREYTFTFTNTINGTTSHFAYKYWKDGGIGADSRPDLHIQVYRYLKEDQDKNPNTAVENLQSYKEFKDHKDPVWTEAPKEDEIISEPVIGYNWKVTVEDLPQYDDQGNTYVYVFKESMANEGKTVLGTYVGKAETKELLEGGTYEIFTNTITDSMTIQGRKTWTGLNGYRPDELPDPLITLYRTTDETITDLQGKTDSEINELLKKKKIVKIDTTHLTGSMADTNDKTRYTFPDITGESTEDLAKAVEDGILCKEGDNYQLPKYDENGSRYIYLVRESFENDSITDQLYAKTNENGTISNVFRTDINLRSITVTKKWDRSALESLEASLKAGENKFPSVTYTLWRYEIGKEETTRKQIDQHTINASEFAEKYVTSAGKDAEVSYTFENLRIYSPAGKQYGYYITENAINGYSITYEDESSISSGTDEISKELQENDRCDVTSLPDNWYKPGEVINTQVSTTNAYDKQGEVTISGQKVWNDYGNLEGLRPDSIKLTLTRRTNSESGQGNQVTETEVTLAQKGAEDTTYKDPYIVWTYGGNDGENQDKKTCKTWTYKIYNLPRYAANGQPYIYTVKEKPVEGYKQTSGVSVRVTESETALMPTLTNEFDGTYYVRKNWVDGDNKYNLRPKEITVKLQRSTDEGKTWNDIVITEAQKGTYNEATGTWSDGLPSVSKDSNGKPVVSVTLTDKNVIANTKNNSWSYRFTNLPTENSSHQKYTYRCVETAIGGAPTEPVNGSVDLTHCKAGSYECTATVTGSQTTLTNMLDDTSLLVTKKWENDSEDLYQSRPEELHFILQKKRCVVSNDSGDVSITEGTWENVTDVNGKVYTFTIGKADNWTKTLTDLPSAEVELNDEKTSYTSYVLYYRAVEVYTDATYAEGGTLTANGNSQIPEGAQNYKDTTDYKNEGAGKAHNYNDTVNRNESTITNTLRVDDPVKSVSAVKVWYKTDTSAAATATFELLYKTTEEDDTQWHCYGEKPVPTDDNWSAHTDTATETGKSCKLQTVSSDQSGNNLKVTWDKLPKYDRDGNELQYKIVEHPVTGYVTEVGTSIADASTGNTRTTFTNIQTQSYTVAKIWQNEDYAEKGANGKFTATFKLQKKTEGASADAKAASGEEWQDVTTEDVSGYADITLSTTIANNSTQTGTWQNLPMYTVDGKQITYRAVETKINGKDVDSTAGAGTNGAYMVSYDYNAAQTGDSPAFGGTKTTVANRMIYGFVNLSKKAAYLAPSITESDKGSLEGAEFTIYKKNESTNQFEEYVTGVTTDSNGNLQNSKGKYGTQQRYLVAGTYKLQETKAPSGFTVWKNGVTFKVGSGETGVITRSTLQDTGEHGTAWISTSAIGNFVWRLKTSYVAASAGPHTIADSCQAKTEGGDALDLESRGVAVFTKKGEQEKNTYKDLDTHENAAGESSVYFGIYTDKVCSENSQVAGMKPKAATGTDAAKMILTNVKQDGTTELNKQNANGLPYLRAFGASSADTGTDYPFTLLSGTYYIKELTAPAGYKLDTTVRKLVVGKIGKADISEEKDTDISGLYINNKAQIMDVSAAEGEPNYSWSNTPNQVTLYKLDQFGRHVSLAQGGYLELKIEGEGNKFPGGETTIRLYQDASKPAAKENGSADETLQKYISYTAPTSSNKQGSWTIRGLLEAGKTYTLSEPEGSVHKDYVIAKQIQFKMTETGSIEVITPGGGGAEDTKAVDEPLKAQGNDYINYYKADAANNLLVLRDASRYRKDVALVKKDSKKDQPIANISFRLYKYTNVDVEGNPTDVTSVLADDKYLTTDQNGRIDLKSLSEEYINQITSCALKYGLDIGKYYFKEVERGASDQYRLAGKIYFEIKATEDGKDTESYDDYAVVEYTTENTGDRHIAEETIDGTATGTKTGAVVVKNDPVTTIPKTLELTKTGSAGTERLAGARFLLRYQSITHGQDGSSTSEDEKQKEYKCITDTDGTLYLANDDWNVKTESDGSQSTKVKPDISAKGIYTLKEIQAPEGYMTITDSTGTPVTLVTWKVDSDNKIKEVKYYNGTSTMTEVPATGSIVTGNVTTSTEGGEEHLALQLTVKNEKTRISVSKVNDLVSGTKTGSQSIVTGEALTGATLEIYEGTDTAVVNNRKATLSGDKSSWSWTSGSDIPEGTLKENTIYTLHESEAPVGYLTADDLYFMLSGTTTESGQTVSQIYVWTGSDKPTAADAVLTNTKWSVSTNKKGSVLTMVDEAIIAPIDLQKVVGSDETENYRTLADAVFTISTGTDAGSTGATLGTAKTNDKGYLVWETITDEGAASGLLYDSVGKHISNSTGAVALTGKSVILQQNADGYTVKETSAPATAHNDGLIYHVRITAANYQAYRTGAGTYATDKYINLVEAEANGTNTGENQQYTVSTLTQRNNNTSYSKAQAATAKLAVNPVYYSTVTLHKYDADEEGAKKAVPGTEFTLYMGTGQTSSNIYKAAYTVTTTGTGDGKKTEKTLNQTGIFTTDANGDLHIEIREKGTYTLVETKAAPGYELDATNAFTFTLAETAAAVAAADADQPSVTADTEAATAKVSLTASAGEAAEAAASYPTYGYGETNALKKAGDETGVPNSRKTGEVTLTKTDADTKETLNGVIYTLSRTDVPKDAEGKDLTSYFLKESVNVETGKSYKAEKTAAGTWQLIEITGEGAKVQSGQIYIKGLPWGNYVLTEKTELSGYVLDNSADESSGQNSSLVGKVRNAFTALLAGIQGASQNDNSGNVHAFVINGSSTDAQGKEDKLSYTFADTNRKNQVTFYKTNTVDTEAGVSTTKPLAGAEFVVCEDDGNGSYKKDKDGNPAAVEFYATANSAASSKIKKVTTGTDGKVTIYGLPTNNTASDGDVAKTYHLVEVKAPKGYQLRTDSVMFTIDRHGNIKVKGTGTEYAAAGDKTVTMADTPIKLYIQKFGESDTAAGKGTEFTLTDTCGTDGAAGVSGCDHKLADGSESKTLTITSEDGKLMLPVESIIAGHTYTLRETKAAAGYQADAVVTFQVSEDGTKIDSIVSTTGGYLISDDKCAVLDATNTTIKIYDKRVGITLTKKDKDTNVVLAGVEFTLTPYAGSGTGSSAGDGTASGFGTSYNSAGSGAASATGTYNSAANTWTFTTDASGQFTIPGGLLLHGGSYLLQETKTVTGYYISKELKDGVILKVDNTGKVTLERQSAYQAAGAGDCPVTLTDDAANNTTTLTAVNTQSTSFTLTKKVEGNMGDLDGTFEIKLSVYEPGTVQDATTLIAQKTIRLKANETYDSVTGLISQAGSGNSTGAGDSTTVGAQAFGKDGIPKGAVLLIEETGDYEASLKILNADGSTFETIAPQENTKAKFSLTLDNAGQYVLELTNSKEAIIDVGITNEKQAPLAAAALLIPAAWLFYRYRRRRRGY